jgi:hypothetical protein
MPRLQPVLRPDRRYPMTCRPSPHTRCKCREIRERHSSCGMIATVLLRFAHLAVFQALCGVVTLRIIDWRGTSKSSLYVIILRSCSNNSAISARSVVGPDACDGTWMHGVV